MKQHKTDITSLIFAIAFIGVAAVAIGQQTLDFDVRGAWIIPFLAALAGVTLLVGGRRKPIEDIVHQSDPEAFDAALTELEEDTI